MSNRVVVNVETRTRGGLNKNMEQLTEDMIDNLIEG